MRVPAGMTTGTGARSPHRIADLDAEGAGLAGQGF